MFKAEYDPISKEVLCCTCKKADFKIFRKDRDGKQYRNHCICQSCGQLFVYFSDEVDRKFKDK